MNKKGTHWNQITDAENRQIALVCDASDAGSGGYLTLFLKDEQQKIEWYGIWNERDNIRTKLGGCWKLLEEYWITL